MIAKHFKRIMRKTKENYQEIRAQRAERKRVNTLTRELIAAVKYPDENAAQKIAELVKQGADVNAYDLDKERSLLHFAAEQNRMDVVKALVENGCKRFINVNDINGKDPAFYAVDNHNPEMLDYLLSHGISTDRPQDFTYSSILRHAVNSGNVQMAEICLKHGADVNDHVGETFVLHDHYERTYPGPTPLADVIGGRDEYNAGTQIKEYNIPMVKLLLDHNARTDLPDAYGHDIMDSETIPEIRQMLVAQRTKENTAHQMFAKQKSGTERN